MNPVIPLRANVVQALVRQLSGTRHALRSLAHALDQPGLDDGSTDTLRGQLEWAAAHLNAAVQELDRPGGASALPDGSSSKVTRPRGEGSQESSSESLQGHSQAIGIAEILGFVSSLKKTGVLRVHTPEENFLVQLENGMVVYAQGDAPPPGLRLGEILVAQGSIQREDLALSLQDPQAAKFLGANLLQAGLISKEALCIALAYQVQHLFHRMSLAQDASFQFDEAVHMMESADIRLNVTQLLLETARSRDEATREAPPAALPSAPRASIEDDLGFLEGLDDDKRLRL